MILKNLEIGQRIVTPGQEIFYVTKQVKGQHGYTEIKSELTKKTLRGKKLQGACNLIMLDLECNCNEESEVLRIEISENLGTIQVDKLMKFYFERWLKSKVNISYKIL